MKNFLMVLVAVILFSASIAHAEIKTYTGYGESLISEETETVDFAKQQSELFAERDALERVSVYIKSISTMIDNELDNDEIITIASGILHVTDTKFSIEPDTDGLLVKAFVTAQIDTDELVVLLDREIQSRRKN